ncbi:MAG: YkgJ family cysteine cluster protein [Pseudomonadota bacterium]
MADKKPGTKEPQRSKCIRCGECCRRGGPALHHEDKDILRAGHAEHRHLVTIREGEWVFDQARGRLKPSARELVKVMGRGGNWGCFFYEEKGSACAIYEQRFLECRLMQCWDTSELEAVMGRGTIARTDIMNPKDPMLQAVIAHEHQCAFSDVENVLHALVEGKSGVDASSLLAKLTDMVHKDLAVRLIATQKMGLQPAYELFMFGRPMFKVLEGLGLKVEERKGGGLELDWGSVRDVMKEMNQPAGAGQ